MATLEGNKNSNHMQNDPQEQFHLNILWYCGITKESLQGESRMLGRVKFLSIPTHILLFYWSRTLTMKFLVILGLENENWFPF